MELVTVQTKMGLQTLQQVLVLRGILLWVARMPVDSFIVNEFKEGVAQFLDAQKHMKTAGRSQEEFRNTS